MRLKVLSEAIVAIHGGSWNNKDELLGKDNARVLIDRYARANTVKATYKKALTDLRESGFDPKTDDHIRNLLRLPPSTDLHDHPLVQNAELILQDKVRTKLRSFSTYHSIPSFSVTTHRETRLTSSRPSSPSRELETGKNKFSNLYPTGKLYGC